MSSGSRSDLLQQFRTLFESGTVAALTDGQLLERFLVSRDDGGEVAFAALVARHGPMVLGVCRRALADPNDVADAFQATFLVLVRKARSIRVDDSLGRWLYGVSRRVAGRARAVAARRPRAEAGQLDALAAVLPDPDGFELAAMLDEELARLPETYRSAVVLCDLGGLTHEEAARDLICPVGTIKSRLSRGRRRLKERLERRGLNPSTLANVPTVPPWLAEAAVRASVVSSLSGKPAVGVVSTSAFTLAEGVLKSMTGIKLKLAAAAALSIGVIATGASVLAQGQRGDAKPPVAGSSEAPGAADPLRSEIDEPGKHVVEVLGDRVKLDGKPATLEGLAKSLQSMIEDKASPGPLVIVRVSNDQKYGDVKRVIDAVEAARIPQIRVEPAGSKIEAKLEEPISLLLKEKPLGEVIELLSQQTGLNFILDPKGLAEKGLTRTTPVSLAAKEIKLKHALKYLLQPLQLTYRVEDDVVLITVPMAAQAQASAELQAELARARMALTKAQRESRDAKDPAIVRARARVAKLEAGITMIDRVLATVREDPTEPKAGEKLANPGRKAWPVRGVGAEPPREFTKVAMPDYIVEPPDVILVEVLEALPGRPISGERLVRPDGKISLGFYGEVYVAGLTLAEIKAKVALHLRQYLLDDNLGLTEINGKTGKVEPVDPARSSKVFVDVTAYNSKVYYVQGDVGVPGRLPITGNDTVLDAINFAGGLIPTAAKDRVRLVRPAPDGARGEQTLSVDLDGIINRGETKTNYQLMPGDRLIVERDPKIALEAAAASRQEGTAPKDIEDRLQTVERKLDEVLKALERLAKP
jgi:RNA polymerase sigma factor (sigma-70 family)